MTEVPRQRFAQAPGDHLRVAPAVADEHPHHLLLPHLTCSERRNPSREPNHWQLELFVLVGSGRSTLNLKNRDLSGWHTNMELRAPSTTCRFGSTLGNYGQALQVFHQFLMPSETQNDFDKSTLLTLYVNLIGFGHQIP